jgi:hypothetical protein
MAAVHAAGPEPVMTTFSGIGEFLGWNTLRSVAAVRRNADVSQCFIRVDPRALLGVVRVPF